MPIYWGDIFYLLEEENFKHSQNHEPLIFYVRFIKFMFLTPIYRVRKKISISKLKRINAPNDVIETFKAINQASNLFNNFVLRLSVKEQFSIDFYATNFSALFIQLSDEFIDNVKNEIEPSESVSLLMQHWDEVFGDEDELPFKVGLEGLFHQEGLDLDKIPTKYNMSCKSLLYLIESLGDIISREISKLENKSKKLFLEKLRLSMEQAFSTFLEELYFNLENDFSLRKIDNEILEHYERKTSSVLAAWLELRAVEANKNLSERLTNEIRNWSRLFFDFQIFDDLKDIKQDFGRQPNWLYLIAGFYPDELTWLEENILSISENGSLIDTIKINLNMPNSISHLKLLSKVNGNFYFSPFQKAIQNYRWRKSWISSHSSFQKKYKPIYLHDFFVKSDSSIVFKNNLEFTVFEIMKKSVSLYSLTKCINIYFSHCLDVLAYDENNYLYKYCSIKNLWHFFIFSQTMSIDKKSKMFFEVLRKGSIISLIANKLQYLAESDSRFLYILECLKNEYH